MTKGNVDKVISKALESWTELQQQHQLRWLDDGMYQTDFFLYLNIPHFQPNHKGEYPASPIGVLQRLHDVMQNAGFVVPVFSAEKTTNYFEKEEYSLYYYSVNDIRRTKGTLVNQSTEIVPLGKTPFLASSFEHPSEETGNTIASYSHFISNKEFLQPQGRPYIQFQLYHPSLHEQKHKGYPNTMVRVITNVPKLIDFELIKKHFTSILAEELQQTLQEVSGMSFDRVSSLITEENASSLSISQRETLKLVQPFFTDFYKKLGQVYSEKKEEKDTREKQPFEELKTKEALGTFEIVNASFKIPVSELSEEQGYELYTNLIEAQRATGIGHIKFRYNRNQKEITCIIDGADLSSLEPRGELKKEFYNSIVKSTDNKGHFTAKVASAKKVPKHFELFFDEFYEKLGGVYETALRGQVAVEIENPEGVITSSTTPSKTVTNNFSVSVESLSSEQIHSIFDNLEKAQQLTNIAGVTFTFNKVKQTVDINIKDVPLEQVKPEGHLRQAFYLLVQGKQNPQSQQCILI